MDCSMPGFPVLHYLLEFAQIHVHWVSDAIQLSYPLLPPSPSALSLSHHLSLPVSQQFTSVSQIIGASVSASVLPMNVQDWSPLGLTDLISMLSKGLSRVFSNTTIQKHQFFGLIYGPTLISVHDYWQNYNFDYMDLCWQRDERLLLYHTKTPGFLASGGEEFNPGPETRLDRSEILSNKVLLKYKGDRESFWHRHQKGVERVPTC